MGVYRKMILTVSERDHHSVWEGPSKAACTDVVIHLMEHLFRNTRQDFSVSFENRLKLCPFLLDLFTVLFGFHFKLNVHELIKIFGWPLPW